MLKDFFIGLAAKGHGPTLYMAFSIQRYTFDHLDILDAIIMAKSALCHSIIKVNKKDMAHCSIFHFNRWKLHDFHGACFFLNILNPLRLCLCHSQGYHDR